MQGLTYIEVPCKVHIRTVTSLGRRFNLIKIVMGLEFVNCNNFLIKKCETWEELISNYRSTTVRYPSRPMSMPPNNEQSQVSLGILRVCTFHFWRCHGLHVILFDDSHGIFFYWYAILFYILVTETLSSKVTAERLKLAGVKEM